MRTQLKKKNEIDFKQKLTIVDNWKQCGILIRVLTDKVCTASECEFKMGIRAISNFLFFLYLEKESEID